MDSGLLSTHVIPSERQDASGERHLGMSSISACGFWWHLPWSFQWLLRNVILESSCLTVVMSTHGVSQTAGLLLWQASISWMYRPTWARMEKNPVAQRSRDVAISRVGGPHGADRWWRRSWRRGPPSSKCLWLWRMCLNLFAILRRRGLLCPPSRVNTACPLWFSFGLCSHLWSGYWNQLHSHSLNKEKCTETDEREGTRLLWILPPTSRSSLGCLGTVVISLDRKLDCSKRSLGDK